MKINYLTEDGLISVKKNLNTVLKKVVIGKECSLTELFKDESMIKQSPFGYEEFSFDMSQPKGKESLTDAENVRRLYSHMSFLSDSQASDERIWAALSLSDFVDYMRYRWPAKDASDITNRYLFGYSPQRSLFRNGIARLWWIGRFTHESKRSDPYELTKFLCGDQDFIENICGRNIFNNPEIGKTVIEALLDAKKSGIELSRFKIREMAKYLNLIGGTYLLDVFDRDYIYEKVMNIVKE